MITTIHNYVRKNIIEEEAKIWESENLWQGYISSPSHASLSIPPSQPEDNISFKATPTVFSQQIQNSLISSNDQMNRPDSSPDAGPPPHPPRRAASLPSGFPLFPPEGLKLFQLSRKLFNVKIIPEVRWSQFDLLSDNWSPPSSTCAHPHHNRYRCFIIEKPDVETKKCEAGDCQAKLAQLERISVTFLRPIAACCGNFVGKNFQ